MPNLCDRVRPPTSLPFLSTLWLPSRPPCFFFLQSSRCAAPPRRASSPPSRGRSAGSSGKILLMVDIEDEVSPRRPHQGCPPFQPANFSRGLVETCHRQPPLCFALSAFYDAMRRICCGTSNGLKCG